MSRPVPVSLSTSMEYLMSKHHLRIVAIAVLAVAAIFTIAQAQSALAQEELLCLDTALGGCSYNGCGQTGGICLKFYPSSNCICGYPPPL